jgi:hypothetical protein
MFERTRLKLKELKDYINKLQEEDLRADSKCQESESCRYCVDHKNKEI